jgi:hypothetical protein
MVTIDSAILAWSVACDGLMIALRTPVAFGGYPLSPTETLITGCVIASFGIAEILLSLFSDEWLASFNKNRRPSFHRGTEISRRSAVLLGVWVLGFGLCMILDARFHVGSSAIVATMFVLLGLLFISVIWDYSSSWVAGKSTTLNRCPHCSASLSFRLVWSMRCPSCGKRIDG